jgi:PAS domain S-box-containing protein
MSSPIVFQFSLKKWVLLSFLFLFSSLAFSTAKQIILTEDEKNWLESHPLVTVGVDQDRPPFDFINADNKHQGISSDYLNHLSKTLNIQFKITAGSWENVVNGVKSKRLDMLACATNTKKRRKFLTFPTPFIEIDSVFVTRNNLPRVNSLADLSGKTVALARDTDVHQLLKNQPQDISFLFVNSNQEALQAVSLGKANAYIGNLAVISHFIEKNLKTNLRIDNRLQTKQSNLGFAISRDQPLLHSILQKGLDTIPIGIRQKITRKWIDFSYPNNESLSIPLTAEETSWLQAHKNIRIGVDPAWAPIEFIHPHKKTYQGIATEYINLLEKKLAIKTHYRSDLSWDQVIKKTKAGDIDILPAISKTPEREKYLNFTRPYLKFPYVIFTRDDAEIITDIAELIDKIIVVEKNYANHEILKNSFPEIQLLLVNSTEQALSALSLGQAFAYMGNLATTSHIILQTGITNIKVAAPTPFNSEIAFAVRKDWPELIPIIQQILDDISQKEHNEFKKKWFSIGYDYSPVIDSSLIWKIISIGSVLFLLISLWLWQNRKQKEALRLSEERFKLAMQASKEGLWDWDIKTDEVYYSPGYAEMLGYQPNDLENTHLSWENLLHSDDKKIALLLVAQKITNCAEHYEHEFRLRHKLGHYLHIRSIGSIICTKNGKATRALGTQQDITEQKITKIALQQQKFALDASAIVAMTDVKGIISYVNGQFCSISGYSRDELIGRDHRLLNSGVHPASFWRRMYLQASKGIPWRQEVCNRAKDGSLYWVDSTILGLFNSQGKLDQYIAIRTDISKRKVAEQKLKQREQQFSSLIHNIPSTFYQYAFNHDWSLSFITDAIESVSGYPASLFVSNKMTLADITHPDDTHIIGKTVHNAIEAHHAYAVEYRIIHKDRSIRWLHDKGTPIYDDEKQPLFLQGAIFDITENKQVELELEKAKQSAEQANRFKSDFLSNMSHEIRTPMNAIIGLGYLAMQTDLTSQQQDYIRKIQSASQSLLTIINDILDFSKIEAGKLHLETVNFKLDSIFENLGDLFRLPAEEKDIELIFDISPKIPVSLIGDPTRLSQILINLCSNAIKFTDQGEIKISVKAIETSESRAILKFSVTDSGCGIEKNKQQHLFDSFFQTDASTTRLHGGTGLGLAISKQLVEMMDGSIGINSIKGQGSTFFFYIECGLDPHQELQFTLPQPDLRGIRVLIVDDNISSRYVLRNQLASLSFKVTAVASASEAYSALKSADKLFDLILMDWSLPDTNGLVAIKYIRESLNLNKIPAIIMATANAQETVAKQTENNHLTDFIIKPAPPSTLFDTIIKVLQPSPVLKSTAVKIKNPTLSGSVLLAEDNKINQQVAEELLKSFGLKVKIAQNGLDAVNQLNASNAPFDLVLMDIQMPEMDGLQATQKIRTNSAFADLPIIAMTAHAMVGDRDKSLAAGMNEHITKPIDPAELYKVLKRWLQYSDNTALPPETKTDNVALLPRFSENIDVKWGLERTGGNSKLFSKLLNEFHQDHHNDIQLLQQAFDKNQSEVAKRIIHTVKGVSGNIGACKLHRQSAKLELAIESEQDYSEELALFTQAFSDLMLELVQLDNQQQAIQTNTAKLSNQQLIKQLKKLYQLLSEGDTDAVDILSTIKDNLSEHSANEVLTLLQSIEDYAFEQAIVILKEILRKLRITLD